MKASEFVKLYGWEHVTGFYEWINKNKNINAPDDFEVTVDNAEVLSYLELKRLVESHKIVDSLGGMDSCRSMVQLSGHEYLKKAIADVESCQ